MVVPEEDELGSTTPGASLLLTGATSGLGLATARFLAGSTEWTVLATARTPTRVEELRALLADPPNFHYVACDQADLGSVRTAQQEIRALLAADRIPPLRTLVLNAGAQTLSTDAATVDGFELTLATNVIGPHLLVGGLSDVLTAPARILAVGSGTHFGRFRRSYGMVPAPHWEPPADLARPRPGDGLRAYATSKLATLYWVHELARRAPAHLDTICFDPGMMPGTGLARDHSALERFGWTYLLPALRVVPGVSTTKRSAAALATLATDRRPAEELRGGYLEVDRLVPSSAESYDPRRELELFTFLDTATGLTADTVAPWWSTDPRANS